VSVAVFPMDTSREPSEVDIATLLKLPSELPMSTTVGAILLPRAFPIALEEYQRAGVAQVSLQGSGVSAVDRYPVVYYHTHHEVYMRTNIVLDDELMKEAFKYAGNIRTKRELIETALREFVRARKMKDVRELKGQPLLDENYDYKRMRSGG